MMAACPTITFRCGPDSTMPDVCRNMQTAIANGRPSQQLHRLMNQRLIDNNRRNSGCKTMHRTPGNNCDEYPFASSQEGTKCSHSRGVHTGDLHHD